ncbi:MAG TPA: hypothetical protein VG099_31555, partial [Gemmataceae bacterium]|nr:hypothetical protein [Gemmataceae bacterium]
METVFLCVLCELCVRPCAATVPRDGEFAETGKTWRFSRILPLAAFRRRLPNALATFGILGKSWQIPGASCGMLLTVTGLYASTT